MERVLLASVFSRSFKGPREGGCVEGAGVCGSYSVRRGRRRASSASLRGATVLTCVSIDTIQFSKLFFAHVTPPLL